MKRPKVMQYTPGPWYALDDDGQHGVYTKPAIDPATGEMNECLGYEVCYCTPQNNEERRQWQRDMHLIAAAPELAAALRDLVDVMTGRMDGETTALHNALAVLRKADGAA